MVQFFYFRADFRKKLGQIIDRWAPSLWGWCPLSRVDASLWGWRPLSGNPGSTNGTSGGNSWSQWETGACQPIIWQKIAKNCMKTRMHSSRMRTVRSRLLPGVCLPQCMLGYTPAWAWAWTNPPGMGLDNPGPLPPLDRMTDMCKNIAFANFVAEGNEEIGLPFSAFVHSYFNPVQFSKRTLEIEIGGEILTTDGAAICSKRAYYTTGVSTRSLFLFTQSSWRRTLWTISFFSPEQRSTCQLGKIWQRGVGWWMGWRPHLGNPRFATESYKNLYHGL